MSKEPDGLNNPSLAVNQLIAEFLNRTGSGERLEVEQFINEHPEHAAELKQHFANVDPLEDFIKTDAPGNTETILKSDVDSDQSTDDPAANTVVRGATDSETSVTRSFQEKTTSSATNLEIPETFGRYAIQKVLGQGAMGAVYLARDTQLDRDVALKIPKFGDSNGVDDEELLERFYREARASATLRSPNICPVYDVGEIDGQHYITMAYIEGRPLKDFTKSKKKHSEKQIITTIRKLAVGLEQALKIGVIHRDLKPANIMVDQQGEPVVMDFGLARRSSSDDVQVTQSGAIIGTPAYMAPEQVAGDQAAIDHQVDIYALGIIMYELITGEMPFKGNLMALLQQIALNNPTKPTDLRPDLDPRLEKICLKMMAGDQQQRYQSMNDVAAALQDVLRHPNRKQKKEATKQTGPKPASIPSAKEESNPALISVAQPKSFSDQLRAKKSKTSKNAKSKSKSNSKSDDSGAGSPPKKMLLAGGLGGLILVLGIIFLVRIGKYDVQITLDDPSITLSVDDKVLNITDGQDVYKLSAGEHKLKLEKEGLSTHVEEFTVSKDGKTALTAKVVNGRLDALFGGESIPAINDLSVVKNPAPASKQQTVAKPADYDKLANGTWKSLSGSREIVVDNKNPGSQYGAGFEWFPETVGRDVLVRAKVKMTSAAGVGIHVRTVPNSPREFSYAGDFNRDQTSSGIAVINPDYHTLGNKQYFNAAVYDQQFFEIAVAAVGDRLSVYIDGKKMVEVADQTLQAEGYIGLTAFAGSAIFKDVEVMHLDKSSELTPSGNYSLQFTNPSSRVDFDFDIDLDDDFTVELWVSMTEPPTSEVPYPRIWGISRHAAITLGQPPGAEHPYYQVGCNFDPNFWITHSTHPDAAPLKKPVHLAVVKHNSKHYFFFNGRKTSHTFRNDRTKEYQKLTAVAPRNMTLGDLSAITGSVTGSSFTGLLHSMRLSRGRRYPNSANFTPPGQLENDQDTLALYEIEEGSGTTLRDSSGNGHHGKIVGAKWVRSLNSAVSPPETRDSQSVMFPVGSIPYLLTSDEYEWTEPENLGPNVNCEHNDVYPTISADGLCLIYTSVRGGSADLFECRRKSVTDPWEPARALVEPNTDSNDEASPWLSPDGLTLLFAVKEPKGDSNDLFETRRTTRNSPWQAPKNLGPIINSGHSETGGVLTTDGLTLYFASNPRSRGNKDLFQARRTSRDSPWQQPVDLGPAINTLREDKCPQLLSDGKSLAFIRGGKDVQLMLAEPTSGGEQFRVQPLDSPVDNISFCLSADGQTMIFDSPRPEGVGGLDLWMSRRVLKGKPAAAPPPSAMVYLDDLPEKSYVGLTSEIIKPGQSAADAAQLESNFPGESAAHAIIVHPQNDSGKTPLVATLIYDIAGSYDRLQARVRVRPGRNPPVFAEVWGDGKMLWKSSNLVRMKSAGDAVDVDVRGVRELKLISSAVEDVRASHLLWIEPRLTPSSSPSTSAAPAPAIAPFDAAQAKAHQQAWAKHLSVPVEYTNSIGMKFRLIPPGEFLMGSTPEEIEEALKGTGDVAYWRERINSEAPQHKVILTQPLYVGVTEVTQSQYEQVMGSNPSYFSATGKGKDLVANMKTGNHPVESVSWLDAAEFCSKLSQQERLKPFYLRSGEIVTPLEGTGYLLPTEAQWELACRAGTTTRFWSGDEDQDLVSVGWIGGSAGGHTHAAGKLRANPFGLFDVHGNVREWVQDSWDPAFYGKFQNGDSVDSYNPFPAASERVTRGGDWLIGHSGCRSSARVPRESSYRDRHIGFRAVLPVEAVKRATHSTVRSGSSSNFALEFEGGTNRVELPDLKLSNDQPFTIELTAHSYVDKDVQQAWIWDMESFALAQLGGPSWNAVIRHSDSKKIMDHRYYSTVKRVNLAAVYDKNRITLFVDGKEVARKREVHVGQDRDVDPQPFLPFLPLKENQTYMLGASMHRTRGFTGLIDEIRVSNSARYQADYTPVDRFVTDAQTVALYHCDEGTGDVLEDSSGNGHHGKIIGAKWVRTENNSISKLSEKTNVPAVGLLPEDSHGYALEFNRNWTPGNSDHVIVPTLKLPQGKSYTMEMWTQSIPIREARNNRHPNLLLIGSAGRLGNMITTSAYGEFELRYWGAKNITAEDRSVALHQPAHLAAVFDYGKQEARLFVNGHLAGSGEMKEDQNEAEFSICNQVYGADKIYYKGWIDEVRLSDTVRYHEDFTPQRRFESDNQTLALYHCDEGTGDVLEDSSGNGHHGKIIGAKWVSGASLIQTQTK